MKQLCTTYLLFFAISFLSAQDLGPLDITRAIESQEFVIFNTTFADASYNAIPEFRTGYLDENSGIPGSPFFFGGIHAPNINRNAPDKSMNVIALDYNGDSYDEVIGVHTGIFAQGAYLNFPLIDKNTLGISDDKLSFIRTYITGGAEQPIYKMGKADFEKDGKEELVIAYRDYRTRKIAIDIYRMDFDNIYTPILRTAHLEAQDFYPLNGSNENYEAFDITVDDFNGDGTPDIALASIVITNTRRCRLTTFKVTPGSNSTFDQWTIEQQATTTVKAIGSLNGWENMTVSSGIFDKSLAPQKQIVVDLAHIDANDQSKLSQIMALYTTESGADGLRTIRARDAINTQETLNNFPAMSLTCGDLNNDGSEEIVRAFGTGFQMYDVVGLKFSLKGTGNGGDADPDLYKLVNNNNYVSIGDIDQNGYLDIIMVTANRDNTIQWFNVDVFESDETLTLKTKASDYRYGISGIACGFNCLYRLSVTFAELRGGRAKLLPPTKINRDIFTPLIVNNSPPYHFDILENGSLEADLTDNFPSWPGGGSQGNWESVYTEVNTSTKTLETELKSDWGISGTLSSDQSGLKWGVKTSATVRYGEAFSESQINTQIITTTTESTAKADDSVRGVLQEFDIYEYPIDSSGTVISYVLAMVRKGDPIIEWLDSKSVNALSYISDHEPGNILSYASDANFNEYSGVDALIKSGDRRNIGLNSLRFEMIFSDFSSSSTTSSKNFGIDVSAEATYQGVTLGVEGTYNQEEIQSHTSTAFSEISFLSNLNRELDGQFTDANYSIQPHAYWAKSGALTLGYTVEPSLSSGSTENFWTKYYTKKPDLTLILPWRHDPAKGDIPTNPEKVRSCKSIFLDQNDSQPGDTITITAFIQNYSFVDYNGPVDFQFYAGRPESGGILLEDINGNTTLTVNTNFKQRDRTAIRFFWKRPAQSSREPIYIVIDPDDKIDEIHEDNNIGFNELSGGIVTSIDQEPFVEAIMEPLLYPNPARDWTQLDLELSSSGRLQVELFDTQGRMIKQLYNRDLHQGRYTLPIDLKEVPAGYYFIRMQTNQQQKTLPLMKS